MVGIRLSVNITISDATTPKIKALAMAKAMATNPSPEKACDA